jgi:hypothetical protein
VKHRELGWIAGGTIFSPLGSFLRSGERIMTVKHQQLGWILALAGIIVLTAPSRLGEHGAQQ